MGAIIASRYPGTCACCGTRFPAGARIVVAKGRPPVIESHKEAQEEMERVKRENPHVARMVEIEQDHGLEMGLEDLRQAADPANRPKPCPFCSKAAYFKPTVGAHVCECGALVCSDGKWRDAKGNESDGRSPLMRAADEAAGDLRKLTPAVREAISRLPLDEFGGLSYFKVAQDYKQAWQVAASARSQRDADNADSAMGELSKLMDEMKVYINDNFNKLKERI